MTRRSTAGSMIGDIEKVFRSDNFSSVGIAGVSGIGLELVRLFELELEYYERQDPDRQGGRQLAGQKATARTAEMKPQRGKSFFLNIRGPDLLNK